MSDVQNVVLPKWGTTMQEADVAEILVTAGETVAEGQALLSIETDKVETDVESPCSGVVSEIRVEVGDVVPVGDVLLVIETA